MKKAVLIVIALMLIIFPVIALEITINSPQPICYGDANSILVNVTTTGVTNSIKAYLDSLPNPVRESYSSNSLFSAEPLSVGDGPHILIINASNSTSTVSSSLNFYMDTDIPVISSTSPFNNSNVSPPGANFTVNYTENNLNSTVFFWKLSTNSIYDSITLSCSSGSSSCLYRLNLSSFFPGDKINYFFRILDLFDRTVNSSILTLNVIACTPSLSYTNSSCQDGRLTETITDLAGCNATITKTLNCTCSSNWQWSAWSNSEKSCGSKTYRDITGCNTTTQTETASCDDDSGSDSGTSSSSGGGEGGTSGDVVRTVILTETQFKEGKSKELSEDDRIKFYLEDETHYITLKICEANKVSIEVSSDPQEAEIIKGETKKFDLTNDSYYDLSIKYASYNSSNDRASLFVKSIYELKPKIKTVEENQTEENETSYDLKLPTEQEEIKGSGITGAVIGAFSDNVNAVKLISIIFGALVIAYTVFFMIRQRYTNIPIRLGGVREKLSNSIQTLKQKVKRNKEPIKTQEKTESKKQLSEPFDRNLDLPK